MKAVREHADAIHGLLAKTSVNVVQIGLRLQAARDALGRAHFQPWLKAEFRWSHSVASNYMRAARAFSELDCLGRFQPSSLFVLARKKCPPAARTDAIRFARQGEWVTKALAVELVGRHTPGTRRVEASERVRQSILRTLQNLSAAQVEELAEELLQVARRMRAET